MRKRDEQAGQTPHKSLKVELLGVKGSLGKVDLEADGSVYLKVKADMPFRMQTIDEKTVELSNAWGNGRHALIIFLRHLA